MVDFNVNAPNEVVNVVEVHQGGQDDGSELWYRAGVLHPGTPPGATTWEAAESFPPNTGQPYAGGYNPVVAVDQNPVVQENPYTTVVEVHQAERDLSQLWYRVGRLTYSETSPILTWGPAYQIVPSGGGISGYAPTVAVQGGTVVVMAQGTDLYTNQAFLGYTIGQVDTNTKTITWGEAKVYDTGYNPSVSMNWSPSKCAATSARG
jgi:hypothetical protein